MIEPGGTIGVLGGGQLGRMIALAATALGYRCHVYCPEKDSPGKQATSLSTTATTRWRRSATTTCCGAIRRANGPPMPATATP